MILLVVWIQGNALLLGRKVHAWDATGTRPLLLQQRIHVVTHVVGAVVVVQVLRRVVHLRLVLQVLGSFSAKDVFCASSLSGYVLTDGHLQVIACPQQVGADC